jgi:hypothetical protein
LESGPWRLARRRDYEQGVLTPYFEAAMDTVEKWHWKLLTLY